MNYYTREELNAKSYEKLYEIALNEKLINLYSGDLKKSELIKIIIKYRENNYKKRIEYKDLDSFYSIQKIIDKNIVEYTNDVIDIQIPRKICIYSDTKFCENDDYDILIDKNLQIDTSIVLLVGKNNYIYVILSIHLIQSDIKYNRFRFNRKYVERFCEEYDNIESMKLLFFDKYGAEIIYNAYMNKNLELVPEKLRAYSIYIFEFEYKKKEKTDKICPIIFSENSIITNYFIKDFSMYVREIKDDKIYIEFFDDANKAIKNKDYIFYGTYIKSINEILKINGKFQIFDDYLKSRYIESYEIINIFIKYLKDEIKSYSKKDYLKYYILGLNIEDEEFEYINIPYILNFGIITNKIDKNINNKSNKILMISSEYNYIDISTNEYLFLEKDINYDIFIKTNINLRSNIITYNNIVNEIFKIIKFKICNVEYKIYTHKEIINYINSNNYYKYIEELNSKYDELEKEFKTSYLNYKSDINDEYLEIKKNYYSLYSISTDILNSFIKDRNFSEFYIKDYNISINRLEIEMIFFTHIYKFLYDFFKDYTIKELLDEFEGINLSGVLVKTNIFYSAIKEFIPGRIISLDDNVKNSIEYLLKIINYYIVSNEYGKIKCFNKYKILKNKINLYVKNFKDEFQFIFNNEKEKIAYIDRIEGIKAINIKIENLDTNEIKYFEYNINNEYIEKDENYIGIDQKYLNDIENNIIRIFFIFEEELYFINAKRVEDQIYISNTKQYIEV